MIQKIKKYGHNSIFRINVFLMEAVSVVKKNNKQKGFIKGFVLYETKLYLLCIFPVDETSVEQSEITMKRKIF